MVLAAAGDSMRRRWWCALAASALAVVVVAVGPAGSASQPALKAKFTNWDETFVDSSRPTEDPQDLLDASSRTLVTTIYRPTGKGPFPLIVFSHGISGHPDKFTKLFAVWASAGYVVAAPAFPLTNDHEENSGSHFGDVAQQPGDISFVIDEVLRLDKDKKSDLFKAVDERKIGASGLSLGGATTYGVVFDDCCRDTRIKAAQVLDGLILDVGDGTGEMRFDGHVPLLLAHSDTDPVLSIEIPRGVFTESEPPVWLVTLHGASHASQWEDDVTPYDEIAEQITLDFWDATLKGRAKAFKRLERNATVEGLSAIEVKR